MDDDVYDHCHDDEDEDEPPPPPPPPPKKFNPFKINPNTGFFPKEAFDGKVGDLPILMEVNVGYDPEEEDPFMYPYESQEVLFAYKEGAQKRVLIQDSHNRTYSLPLQSPITFRLTADSKEELTLSQTTQKHKLPITGVDFARPDTMDFDVELDFRRIIVDHSHFGLLTLQRVYDEPYYYCLSIVCCEPRPEPRVLPRNLKEVSFSPINRVKGAVDSAAKLQEFVAKYSKFAQELDYHGDPFFQELALVSKGPDPIVGDPQPYIDNSTFIAIKYHRRHIPDLPHAPLVPTRQPVTPKIIDADPDWDTTKYRSKEWKSVSDFDSHYTPLVMSDDGSDDHVYTVPSDVISDDDDVTEPAVEKCKNQAVVKPTRRGGEGEKDGGGKDEPDYTFPPRLPPFRKDASDVTKSSSTDDVTRKSSRPPQPLPGENSGVGLMSPPPLPPFLGSASASASASASSSPPPPLPPGRHRQGSMKPQASHLSSLTVEDVAHKLKDLGLGKHSRKFLKNKIDGILLQKLAQNYNTLESEFGMTSVECIKLRAYVNDGHVPVEDKETKKKGGGIFGTLGKR